MRIQFSPATLFSGQNSRIRAGWTGSSHSLNRTAGSHSAGRDLAVPRTEQPDPARLDGIWPFPARTSGSRPASRDGRDLALSRPDWPDSGLFGRGLGRRGEWSGISGGMLCFRHGIFTDRWKGHFCLYVRKYFLIHFTIKLMWSHLLNSTSVSKTLLVKN